MSKYDPLGNYLNTQNREHIPMTFSDIERVLGVKLPASKQYPAWWSNNTSNNVMTQQWLDAGYQTKSVDIVGEKLIFHRLPSAKTSSKLINISDDKKRNSKIVESQANPIFGCMKGTVTIPDDVDLTEPADSSWAQIVDEKIKEKHPI